MMDRTLASSAFPCAVLPPTGQKPLIFSSFRAFFAFAEAPLLTTLPLLFLRSELFGKPPTVFSFLPLKTADLANLPLPILLTFMTFFFIDFFAFIAFEAFMAAFFMGAFMAASAIAEVRPRKGETAGLN